MKKSILYPDALAVVDQAEVQDDTFYSIQTILDNGFTDFDFGTEAIAFTRGFESFFSELFTPSGHMNYEGTLVSRSASLAVTMGLFSHAAHALMQGMHPDDVKNDYQVNYEGAQGSPDGTGQAAVPPESLVLQEFTLLARCPLRRPAGHNLYIYLPKCSVEGQEQTLNLRLNEQIKPAIQFNGLVLDTDELAKHQGIFSGVSRADVAYIWTGAKS